MRSLTRTLAIALAGGAAILAMILAARDASAQQITGAGSSLAAPIYAKWGEAAKAAVGVELNYQSIGSGAGLNQVVNRTVDFGASDAPVDPAKLASAHLLQFPTVIGAVVMIVNVPGLKTDELKLTGDVVADIYLGSITKWNDPKIAELNPGVKLPSLAIAPVYRADASGTTLRIHLLSRDGRGRLEVQGRRRHQREVAGRQRREGQRWGRRHGAPGQGRGRLHRVRLRGQEPPYDDADARP